MAVDPLPQITALQVLDSTHTMMPTGEAGPTDATPADLYWEVEIVAGDASLVFGRRIDVDLSARLSVAATLAIPLGISLDGRRIRLCVEEPTAGLWWASPWQYLDGRGYDAADRGVALPPGPPVAGPLQLAHVGQAGPGVHAIPTRDLSGGANVPPL